MDLLTQEEFEANVIQWGKDRNIIGGSTVARQLSKTLEETGEFLIAVEEEDEAEIKDALGDMDVTLVLVLELIKIHGESKIVSKNDVLFQRETVCDFAKEFGFDVNECRTLAWDAIKDRKGKMVNGVFVKEVE